EGDLVLGSRVDLALAADDGRDVGDVVQALVAEGALDLSALVAAGGLAGAGAGEELHLGAVGDMDLLAELEAEHARLPLEGLVEGEEVQGGVVRGAVLRAVDDGVGG